MKQKTNFIIIHGAYGNPEENWFPWLKYELESLGHSVYIPKFPTPKGQNLENWLKVFEEYKRRLDVNSVLIGHSTGAVFVLNLIERLDHPIKSAYFVSGFTRLLSNPIFDPINRSFVDRKFNWEKIKKNCKHFTVYHSDNDSYVPLDNGRELARKLGVQLILVKDAGHFNTRSGYSKFDILLGDIKSLLEEKTD